MRDRCDARVDRKRRDSRAEAEPLPVSSRHGVSQERGRRDMNPGAPPHSAQPTSGSGGGGGGGSSNSATKSNARSSGYHQKALAEIRNSLLPFANAGQNGTDSSVASTTSTASSGIGSVSGGLNDVNLLRHSLGQLLSQGFDEVFFLSGFIYLLK